MSIVVKGIYFRCRLSIYNSKFAVYAKFKGSHKKFVSGYDTWQEAWNLCQVIYRLDPEIRMYIIPSKNFFSMDNPILGSPLDD